MPNSELIKLLMEAMFRIKHDEKCRFSGPYRTSFDACICGANDILNHLSYTCHRLDIGKLNVYTDAELDEEIRQEILKRRDFERVAYYLGGEDMREKIMASISSMPPVKQEDECPLK